MSYLTFKIILRVRTSGKFIFRTPPPTFHSQTRATIPPFGVYTTPPLASNKIRRATFIVIILRDMS